MAGIMMQYCNMHCILHAVYCILYTVYFIICNELQSSVIDHCVVCSVYCDMCTVYCTVHSVHILNSAHITLYSIHYTVWCLLQNEKYILCK